MNVVLFLLLIAAWLSLLWALRRWAEREPLPEWRRAELARQYSQRPSTRHHDIPDRDYVL